MESRKRKPLSDITNTYNLIPTSTLRKLVADSSNSNASSKPPISILKSNSSSTNQKLCSESSNRSDTSIGSSNVSAVRSSRTVQFRTPPRAISSITSHGGMGGKDASHNRRQTTETSKKEREAVFGPTPVEKKKDKGKAIAVQSNPAPEKLKDNQNDDCNPCIPLEREKRKHEANISLLNGEIVKESGKRTLSSHNSSCGKTEKQKVTLNYSGGLMKKQEEFGKGIVDYSSRLLEKIDKGKKGIPMPSAFSILETEEFGNEFVNPSSFLGERTMEKGKPLNSFSCLDEKTREKRKVILQPSNTVEITKDEGSSASAAVNCRPPRKKSVKRKNDAGASSCPPMLRSKTIWADRDEAGDVRSSKSWTDPHPKCRKKRCSKSKSMSELPQDFIEQQKAYFKEVDEFELPVEEVSEDELE